MRLFKIECPAWWPQWFCVTNPVLWALLCGAAFGAFISWEINRPTTPWLRFLNLEAAYTSGAEVISLKGRYRVFRECTDGKGPLIWRTEAIATDGQTARYGTKPEPPEFIVGTWDYADYIPLTEKIRPDGWVVRIFVTCPGEVPETVASPPARIVVHDGGTP